MPPLPPAKRPQATTPAARTRLSTRHRRFLRLFCAGDPPGQGLSQDEYDALPTKCQDALRWATTATHLPESTRKALVAFYGSGHRPSWIPPHDRVGDESTPYLTYDEDIEKATALLEAPDGNLAVLMSALPGGSDSAITARLLSTYEQSELKPGEKVRLETGRLLLQMKGHLREQNQQVTQATQIVLHLDTHRSDQSQLSEKPAPLTLDLIPKRPPK